MKKIYKVLFIIMMLGLLMQTYIPVRASDIKSKDGLSDQGSAESDSISDVSGNNSINNGNEDLSADNDKSGDDKIIILEFVNSGEFDNINFEERVPLEEIIEILPEAIEAKVIDGNIVEIPVTWKCAEDYENTAYQSYTFNPSWEEQKYQLSEQLAELKSIPYIEIVFPAEEKDEQQAYLEQAREALENVKKETNISALIYLCDKYSVREAVGKDSSAAVSVPSGTTVQITGVEIDIDKNIWYKVSFALKDNQFSGFVEKAYLAYSNEFFIEWEGQFMSKYIKTSRTRSLSYADIEQFPESYQYKLMQIKKSHPNWIFVKQTTGLNWNTVIVNEDVGNRNLVSSSAGEAYKNGYDGAGWYIASRAAVEYYVDPRNFLTDTQIFQFEQLTYNPSYHTKESVQGILGATFMSGNIPDDNKTYSQAFFEIGVAKGVSPFHLACRVYQEQGKGTSGLISGTYTGYEGYYNFYNIGASGSTTAAIITSGLTRAKKEGWNTRYKSLNGGAAILSGSYILKGQDTLYLQKFDVDSSYNGLYWHQYMQNIMAPYTECQMVKKAYFNTGSLDNTFVFKIPVYTNMPASACPAPGTTAAPTASPTAIPTAMPTAAPTAIPTEKPAVTPTPQATVRPTATETPEATSKPTQKPEVTETPEATSKPTQKPEATGTPGPTSKPTQKPTERPTATVTPTAIPTAAPQATPTQKPTVSPTKSPAATQKPTEIPTVKAAPAVAQTPAVAPTPVSTAAATQTPTDVPEESPGKTEAPAKRPASTPIASPKPDTIVMDISKTGMLYEETFNRIKEQGVTAELNISDSLSWKIDGSSLPGEGISDTNLKVEMGTNHIPKEMVNELAGNLKYLEISLAHEGAFGFTAVLMVKLEDALPNQYANLFYYNLVANAFEFAGASVIDEEKKAEFVFNHASDYLIIISDNTLENLLAQRAEANRPAIIAEEITIDKEAVQEELPAEEPVKAAGIIVVILLVSTAIGLGAYLIYRKKDDRN